MPSEQEPPAACPVDHKTRETWLKQSRSQSAPATPTPTSPPTQLQAPGCDSSQLDLSRPAPQHSSILSSTRLGTQREVSSIPRATSSQQGKNQQPANNERDTGADAKTGNWIYPSEEMFFNAMKRKSYEADAADMRTIVPIHNAVNERAWHEIKQWEKGRGSEACGGPRLASFSGLSTSLTPRARWNAVLGYQTPFDRHDWVVDRCGTKVEYVIDFYSGKDERRPGKELNFYLDVRPKLNSWEGVKMRVMAAFGL